MAHARQGAIMLRFWKGPVRIGHVLCTQQPRSEACFSCRPLPPGGSSPKSHRLPELTRNYINMCSFLTSYLKVNQVLPLVFYMYTVQVFLMSIYLFLRGRDGGRSWVGEGRRERGRHRIRSSLQALSCQHRAQHEAQTHNPEFKSQMLHWVSQPGTLQNQFLPKDVCGCALDAVSVSVR